MKKIRMLLLVMLGSLFLGTIHADMSRVYDYIEDVAIQDKERLPQLGVWLASVRAHTTPSTQEWRTLSEALAYVREVYARVGAPSGYAVGQESFISLLEQSFHEQGESTAPILVLEFADFQCPYCQKQARSGLLDTLRDTYPDTVRTAFAHFPLGGEYHLLAEDAAIAAECVYEQGGIDAFYSFKQTSFITSLQPTQARMLGYVRNLGLDTAVFESCQQDEAIRQRVLMNKELGIQLGVRGTPYSTIIDTRSGALITLGGAQPIAEFRNHIDIFLAQ